MLSEKYNVNESIFDLTTPEDISKVHSILKDSGLKQKYENNIFMMAKNADETKKPNLIFNKTCKGIEDILYICAKCKEAGYKPENIHLVWVLNNIETSLEQNKARSRTLSDIIVKSIHQRVAETMKLFLENDINDELNGDIWIVFNNRKNNDIEATPLKQKDMYYIKNANMIKIKESGNSNINLDNSILNKIKNYVPVNTWNTN